MDNRQMVNEESMSFSEDVPHHIGFFYVVSYVLYVLYVVKITKSG